MFSGFCVPSNKLTNPEEGAVEFSVVARRSQVKTKFEDTGRVSAELARGEKLPPTHRATAACMGCGVWQRESRKLVFSTQRLCQ